MKFPRWVATSTVGEKMTPPRTRQLSTTLRVSGRYHEASPTSRVNCWNEAEPSSRELTVTSIDLRLPRDGSIGLLVRGKLATPVIVARTRFWRSRSTTSSVQALNEAQK